MPNQKNNSLGKGISELVDLLEDHDMGSALDNDHVLKNHVQFVPIHHIYPNRFQPRAPIAEEHIESLAESLKHHGLLQPIVVRTHHQNPAYYELIAGERRWRAAQLAGFKTIPALIKQFNDQESMLLALIENIQRKDLSILDKARAYHRIITKQQCAQSTLAAWLSVSRSQISNTLRLLELSIHVKSYLEKGQLDMGHARCLLSLPQKAQADLAKQIVDCQMSVREAEALVQRWHDKKNAPKTKQTASVASPHAERIASFKRFVKASKVTHHPKGKGGRLVIHYEDEATLDCLFGLHETSE
jgi:ParB family transcriptional regulator, chromosome partitioning protein